MVSEVSRKTTGYLIDYISDLNSESSIEFTETISRKICEKQPFTIETLELAEEDTVNGKDNECGSIPEK